MSFIDRLNLQNLGYTSNDIDKISSDDIFNILKNNIKNANFNIDKLKNSSVDVSVDDHQKPFKEGQKFIAKKNIPVDNDEGVLHFDEYGASVITKNEALTFLGYVEKEEYGLFKTSSGEEFFMPLEKKNSL